MSAFEVRRIDHVVFRVRDMSVSVGFYANVLGLSVARERPDLGLVHMRAGKSMLDLVSVSGPLGKAGGAEPGQTGRNVDHLCLRVEPFDENAIRERLLAQGLPPPQPAKVRFGAEGEGPSLYVQDPDGNTIELKGPPVLG